MNKLQLSQVYKTNADKFDALSIRERVLFGGTLLVVVGFCWWHFIAAPMVVQAKSLQTETQQISAEVSSAQLTIDQVQSRLKAGVHKEKEDQLARLKLELLKVEKQLQLKATELIDPEEMFQLMTQLIYKESRLKLVSLKRREVKPALEAKEGQRNDDGIYRHVLELKFSGKYEDILTYMTALESLDWKLIWDEIEIISDDHPIINVKVVISTLSTRKEWVGV